jgi:hypothetical protein
MCLGDACWKRVFCKGLSEVISVEDMNAIRICGFVRSPRRVKDLLVWPVYLLKKRLQEQSCEFLAASVSNPPRVFEWNFTSNPFQCPSQRRGQQERCWRHRLQEANANDTTAEQVIRGSESQLSSTLVHE